MLIGIFGENCSGKSTLARSVQSALGGETVSGKDYLRMASSESAAVALFKEKLREAVSGANLIYVISEPEQLALLPDGAVRILVSADLETIKNRFRARMHGTLPEPVERMLERKHGAFDGYKHDFLFDGVSDDAALCCALKDKAGSP